MGKAWLQKAILPLIIVTLALGSTPGAAFGQQQQGPVKPPPPQQQQQQAPPAPQKPPQYAVTVQSEVVTVDVVVTDDNGDPIPGLKQQNFRVLEDNVPQTIANFTPTDAPITVVMLMEFSELYYGWFAYIGQSWAINFLNDLRPNDWIAFVTFDLQPHILVDFTRDKNQVRSQLESLYFPGFHEADLFDSVLDMVDRLRQVKGKNALLIIASGLNTFSHHTLDDVLNQLKETDTTIFCVGVARPLYEYADAQGMLGSIQRLDFLQAENELGTFARMTGGRAWFPRFDGELPGIFAQVAESLRTQYTLAYTPSGHGNDGKYHKIKVQLIAPNGQPLIIVNQKNKKVKFQVYARQGYQAPKPESASK